MLRQMWGEETGLTTIEYALLFAIMGVAALIIGMQLGSRLQGSADTSVSKIPPAGN